MKLNIEITRITKEQKETFLNLYNLYTVQELFVLKKYRGTKIASITVEKVLGQLSGKISICQLAANQRAVAFWKKYYREHHIDYVETRERIPIDGLEGLQEIISQSFEIQRTL